MIDPLTTYIYRYTVRSLWKGFLNGVDVLDCSGYEWTLSMFRNSYDNIVMKMYPFVIHILIIHIIIIIVY